MYARTIVEEKFFRVSHKIYGGKYRGKKYLGQGSMGMVYQMICIEKKKFFFFNFNKLKSFQILLLICIYMPSNRFILAIIMNF